MISGQLCTADLATLRQWASEGRVKPTNKVRKGSLNWISAGHAPDLRSVFSTHSMASVSLNEKETQKSSHRIEAYPQSAVINNQPVAHYPICSRCNAYLIAVQQRKTVSVSGLLSVDVFLVALFALLNRLGILAQPWLAYFS